MLKQNIDLKPHSNYKIGGPARYFYEAKTVKQLVQAVEKARQLKLPIFILGGGTNLLIDDKGFVGAVIKPAINKLKRSGNKVTVGAGVTMVKLHKFVIANSLSGLEWSGGLPGTFGGAVRGNAGAFGGEIKDCIKEVVSLDISGKKPKIIRRGNKQCKFDYRNSIFKMRDGKEIILEATLVLKKGDKKEIRESIEEKIRYRLERHPMDYPNIGSTFKNVDVSKYKKRVITPFEHKIKPDPFPVIPAAVLISQAGLKGVAYGGAMISPKHPNFIVNVMDAKASEVKALIRLVKSSVKEKFGVELEEEIQQV